MNKSYDVYMCRNEERDAVWKIANALSREDYRSIGEITKRIRSRGCDSVQLFINELNRSHLIKNRMILDGIAKILNGQH